MKRKRIDSLEKRWARWNPRVLRSEFKEVAYDPNVHKRDSSRMLYLCLYRDKVKGVLALGWIDPEWIATFGPETLAKCQINIGLTFLSYPMVIKECFPERFEEITDRMMTGRIEDLPELPIAAVLRSA